MRGSREQSQYVHGSDFLVHFAGKKGRIKVPAAVATMSHLSTPNP